MMLNIYGKQVTLNAKYLNNWTLERKKISLVYEQLSELLTMKHFQKLFKITIKFFNVSSILPEIFPIMYITTIYFLYMYVNDKVLCIVFIHGYTTSTFKL